MLKSWRELLTIALIAFSGIQTYRIERLKAAPVKERLKIVERVVERQAEASKITEDVGTRVAQREADIRYITRTIVQEIPVYVTQQSDDRCTVPVGFVRLHDAAAAGTPAVPLGAGEFADTPSGLELSSVASTVVGNYGESNVWREQVLGWQAWYAEQKAAWDQP